MNLKNGKVFTSKSVGTGPSSYEKKNYRAAVSQRLRNTGIDNARDSAETREDFTARSPLLLSDCNQDWNEATNGSETSRHGILCVTAHQLSSIDRRACGSLQCLMQGDTEVTTVEAELHTS